MRLFSREIIDCVKKWLGKPEIIILLGARQVGKTCVMKLLMQELKPNEYLYFDLEDTYNLQILNNVESFLDYISAKGVNKVKKLKVFIDEFQYLPQPGKFLKIIHDHHPQIKLIVSGSSSFEIRRKFTDALTGRKVVLSVYPLTFREYLIFKQSKFAEIKDEVFFKKIITNFEKVKKYHVFTPKMVPAFEDFMIFGGYPLPTLTKENEHKIMRLKEIHNTYIQKDIKDLAKIERIVQFNRLVSYLAVQIGGLLNLNESCKEIGISRRHLEKFIFILEKTFVLNLLKPFFTNRQKEITKMPKVFFSDNGLRNININDVRPLNLRQDKGALAENTFFQEILKKKEPLQELYYWRTKERHEVDFIILRNRSPIPVEIKYQRFKGPEISTSLRAFIYRFSPTQAVIITRDFLHKIKFAKTEVFFVPLWMI
ncbi:MAG: ATP-binding protein [Candidatus Edwardsbacteria bacterium]